MGGHKSRPHGPSFSCPRRVADAIRMHALLTELLFGNSVSMLEIQLTIHLP
jgi:hypothetical protein